MLLSSCHSSDKILLRLCFKYALELLTCLDELVEGREGHLRAQNASHSVAFCVLSALPLFAVYTLKKIYAKCTVSYMTEGAVSYMTEGTFSYMTEGTFSYMMEGTVSCMTESTVSYMTEGTVSYMTEGTVSYMTERTVSYMTEVTVN